MNQILVTEKLYVTPELKRKRKIYKASFILSIFLVIALSSSYIYADYDRNKSAEVSQVLLENVDFNKTDDEDILEENMLIIGIVEGDEYIIEETSSTSVQDTSEQNTTETNDLVASADQYVSPSGDTYSIIATISIPKINIEYAVLSKTTVELLKMSPCKFWGVNPNEIGNCSIAAHNYWDDRFFSQVPTLENGDIIEITDLSGRTIQYSVYDKYTVYPEDTSCTNPVTDGTREVTLITCTNDSKQRVIVKAREIL